MNAAVLTVQSIRHVFLSIPDGAKYFQSWEDYIIFGLFCVYTIEALCRVIVSGLLIDPEVPFSSLSIDFSGLKRQGSLRTNVSTLKPRFMHSSSTLRPTPSRTQVTSPGTGGVPMWEEKTSQSQLLDTTPAPSSLPPSNTPSRLALHLHQDLPFRAALSKQLDITSSRPYLRHSWNRVDALAIVSFWIMFILCVFGQEKTAHEHLYIFRALAVLRTTRLLAITSGTTTIMTSLKKAAPQLVNVTFFVMFAIVLFSIVGVQSFKGSFRRNCVLGTYL